MKEDDSIKIIIMSCSNGSWYKEKIGKVYKVQAIKGNTYITKDGAVLKKNAEVIEQ